MQCRSIKQCKGPYTWQGNIVDYIFKPFMNKIIILLYILSIFRSKRSELCVLENHNIEHIKAWKSYPQTALICCWYVQSGYFHMEAKSFPLWGGGGAKAWHAWDIWNMSGAVLDICGATCFSNDQTPKSNVFLLMMRECALCNVHGYCRTQGKGIQNGEKLLIWQPIFSFPVSASIQQSRACICRGSCV